MKFFPKSGFKRSLLLGFPVAVVLLLAGSVYWLLHTSSGAAWIWSRVEGLVDVDISSSQVKGDLAGGFHVQNLAYRSDGLDLTVDDVELRLQPRWWPLSLVVHKLSLADLVISIHSPEAGAHQAEGDADIRNVLAAFHTPVPLEIRAAELTRIKLAKDGDPEVFLIDSVRFGASFDRQLVVDHFDILTRDLEASLQAHLDFTPPFGLAIDAQGRFEKPADGGTPALVVPFKLAAAGDLDKLHFELTSAASGLQVGGDLSDPLARQLWDISATLDELAVPEEMTGQRISLSGLRLVSQGGIDNWSFGLDSNLQTDSLQEAKLAVTGTGTADGIEISDAVLTGSGLDVGVSGRLDWSEQPAAAVKVIIGQLDPSPWLSAWPAGEPLTGSLELHWSGTSLQITESRLNVESTGTRVDISTDIDTEANRVEARLDWSNLKWPLTGGANGFASKSGRLEVSGSADDWLANGLLDVQLGDYPKGRFEIRGGGNRTSARLNVPGGEILGGSISGEAGADWSNALNWDAVVNANGIDPGPLLAEWPGRLNGKIKIRSQEQPRQLLVEVEGLNGVLRGVPVSARGGLEVSDGGMGFKQLEARTDVALLTLNGAIWDPAGVQITFDGLLSPELMQGAHGKVQMEGRYSSFATQPVLELQLQALNLSWSGISAGSLAVSTSAAVSAGPLPALQLDATSLAWNDVVLDDFSAAFKPAGDNVELKITLVDKDLMLNSLMTLTPEDMNSVFDTNWRGALAGLAVDLGPAYHFELSKPAAFVWSAEAISLEPVCLAETAGASLCLAYEDRGNGGRSVVADATAVPFDYLRDYLGLDVHFEQSLEGHMEWHQLNGQAPTGGAEFRITAGRILDLLDDAVLAQTNEGRFAFTLQNGNLESGVLDLEFPGNGFIDLDFNILDIVGEGEQRIQGRAIARLDKLMLAGEVALPGLDAVDGRFESDIQIGGTPLNPEFEGGFRISNGLIGYAPIGLKLEDIEIEGHVIRRDQGAFKGRFKAGEGVGSVNGRFLFDDAGSAQLVVDLSGGPLLLVNTDALKIHTQSEVRIALSPDRVDINGQITIPDARLTPANLQLGEVRDSEDLVIETYQDEADEVAQKPPAKRQYYGQLDVTLGNGVFVKVPGIETTISGSTRFDWSGGPVPLAHGAYTIHGTVDIYGPKLQITNGSVSFPGVPADNPILNIRAGRDIYGNTQIRSAGVQMIGTLKHPVLEAYTVPVTNEDRAWALLVTGSDFDQAQGVSGFDLGTYIAPKLYVSYGISLFQEENVVSARYDLKKGFGIKVTSGQRETGLDVSYTIDR